MKSFKQFHFDWIAECNTEYNTDDRESTFQK